MQQEESLFKTEGKKTRGDWYRYYSSQKRDALLEQCKTQNVKLSNSSYIKKSKLIELLMQQRNPKNRVISNDISSTDSYRRKTSLKKQKSNSRLTYPNRFNGSLEQQQGPREYMEDTFVVSKFDDMTLYGVFDGHGGDQVSNILPKLMSERLMKGLHPSIRYHNSKLKQHITKTCLEIDQYLSKQGEARDAGSTATMLLHIPPLAHLINIGDSRTILARSKNNNGYTLLKTSTDHKPDLTREHERIVQSGGSVSQEMDDDARVDGVLAMSRALGDHELKYYTHPQSQEYGPVSSRPEIHSISLENDQKYLAVLASDGLWDVVDNEKALKYVHHFGVAQAAKPLTSFALEKGSSDNITTLIVQL